jgi:hypothetical protein
MIDRDTERLMTLTAAARTIPSRKEGSGVAPSTLWRWHVRGVRGVRLETLLVGGLRFTSNEAIKRFFERSTAAADGTTHTAPTVTRQRVESLAAEQELIAAGL